MLFKSLLALAALTSPAFSNPTPEHGQARDAPFVLTQEYAQGLFDNLKNRDTWPNFLNVLDDSLESIMFLSWSNFSVNIDLPAGGPSLTQTPTLPLTLSPEPGRPSKASTQAFESEPVD